MLLVWMLLSPFGFLIPLEMNIVLAIEWLNAIAGGEVSFFLLTFDVFKIDESLPAVQFYLESGEPLGKIKRVFRNEKVPPSPKLEKELWDNNFKVVF